MKIFVTGADSFVAKNFMERYANRHKFYVPSEDFDLTDISTVVAEFRRRKIDAVLHTADYDNGAEGFDSDIELKNVLMFKNIQSVATAYGVKKVIVLSNERELNPLEEWTQVSEQERLRLRPTDSYGYSKYIITDFARFDKNVFVLRPFALYGKYMPENNFVYQAAFSAIKGQEMTVEKDGTFSAVYIDDFVKIINDFLTKNYPAGDYNIVTNEPLTVRSVLNRFKKESQVPFRILEKSNAPERTVSNAKFLETVGGAYRFSSHRNGLTKFYKWLSDTND